MKYTIYSKITRIFQYQPVVRSRLGPDKEPIHETENHGWFIHLEGSNESIFVGFEEPTLQVGDNIKITLEKAEEVPDELI